MDYIDTMVVPIMEDDGRAYNNPFLLDSHAVKHHSLHDKKWTTDSTLTIAFGKKHSLF